jgi:type II secretory pathway component GspD/PulD (secretin)
MLYRCLILSLLMVFLASCSRYPFPNEHDPYSGKTRQDYEDLLAKPAHVSKKPAKIKIAPNTVLATKLHQNFNKKISIHISEEVSLKDVLSTLAKQAGVDLEMATAPEKGISFNAKNVPFIDVIKRIASLIKWRYHIDGACLRLEPDAPFLKNYNVQFLSLRRESKDNVSVATKLLNSDSGVSLSNGSESAIQSSMTSDFWEELATSLNIILMDEPSQGGKPPFAIHKQSGILSIYATTKKHEVIGCYLKKLRKITSAQVLIEAKVVEVTLKNEYRSGINWSALKDFSGIQGMIKGMYGGAENATEGLIIKAEQDQMSGILNLMDRFGTTRTLSSPRLTVMNNQPAILKVVENQVYFNIKYDTYHPTSKKQQIGAEPFTNVQSQIQTVPIGLILTVQPSIDLETGEIIMALRPTISSCAGYMLDPAVELAALKYGQEIKSKIPVVKIDEINSVLRIGNEMVVLGGMMQEVVRNNQQGLPGLMDNPLSGLFSNKEDNRQVKELVIFLRAEILEDEPEIADADKRLLADYTTDPRP